MLLEKMKKRIASIDYGMKRLGVAISDENKLIATSLGVVHAGKNSNETIGKLLELLKPYALERIILGYPIHLNGRVGLLADEVKHFLNQLQLRVACEVTLFDERLSSVQAERSLKEAGMRRKKRAEIIDAVSAVILLQSYLGY
jgi:putative holliday junction resolvase